MTRLEVNGKLNAQRESENEKEGEREESVTRLKAREIFIHATGREVSNYRMLHIITSIARNAVRFLRFSRIWYLHIERIEIEIDVDLRKAVRYFYIYICL